MVNALKNLRVEQVVVESPEDLAPFGLQEPGLKIEVLLSEGEQAPPALLVGAKSPVGQNAYARREGEDKVLLLSTVLDNQFDKSLYDLREKKLFRFKQDEVEGIRLLQDGKLRVELAREEGQWKIVHPKKARASKTEVNKIVSKLTGLRAESFARGETGDLSPFGLEPPAWEVEMSLAPDHARASLLLSGKKEEDGGDIVYAKRGETAQVVSLKTDILDTIKVAPDALREKKIFPFDSWKVKKVDLDWGDRQVTLEKREEGKWWITDPLEARAASGKISPFLSSLSRLEGEAFLDRSGGEGLLASCGLEKPLVKITPYVEDGASSEDEGTEKRFSSLGTLLLGKGDRGAEAYYAFLEGGDEVAGVGWDLFEKDLPSGPEELREKKLMDLFRYQVAAIDYAGPEGKILLEKEKGNWKLKKPHSRDAEEGDVNNLISTLTEMEAVRFLERDAGGSGEAGQAGIAALQEPEMTFTLRNEEGEDLGTLFLSGRGPEGEKGLIYAQKKEDGWIGLINLSDRKDLVERLSPFLKDAS